ncbi:MAG: M23 family metallopeptidase [Leptospiraceae bacterium]|nr:M23 family metallopeptidase [Leptospiraceae bacterium]MCP5493499.1 M23 family metallopeptidase [Leptospiraceae bacterium]
MILKFFITFTIIILFLPINVFSTHNEPPIKNYMYSEEEHYKQLLQELQKNKKQKISKPSLDRGIVRSKTKRIKRDKRSRYTIYKKRRKRGRFLNKPIHKSFSDNPERPHKGILFQPDEFGEVISPLDGKVVVKDYMDGYEKYIIIEHNNGYSTVYGNLDEIYVDEEQSVKKGVLIGTLVKHKGLYFQINRGKKPVDPNKLLKYK